MSVPNSSEQIRQIQGSEPYELKDNEGNIIGVNGAFVWKQFQEIERTKTVSDISLYLFVVQDPRTLTLATINKRQVLLAMLMNHMHALYMARKPDDTMEIESNLIDKYKWFMNLDLENDQEARSAFESFKTLIGADSSNTVLDWNTFIGYLKNPIEFAKLYKKSVKGPLKAPVAAVAAAAPVTPAAPAAQTGGSLTVFWTRHALSCANVLKDLGEKRKRGSLAPNSSIADIGIEQCRQFKEQIQTVVPQELDFVGASALLRAQQTAALLYNPEKVHVIPYISEKRSLLPDDDNQPMTEAKNTEMFEKFKEYMGEKYIFDADDAKVKSNLRYTFTDMFGVGEKEAFKVNSDSMSILPKIYETLVKNNKTPGKKDFTIAIVSHQGWLRDAKITSAKVMNCAVVKQVFTVDGAENLKRQEAEIVFPKKDETPSVKLGGLEFTFTPSIQPSLKDVFNKENVTTLSENDKINYFNTYVGICNVMQENYISDMQKSPAGNFFKKTLKKGRNVGKKTANVTRGVGQQAETVRKQVVQGTRKIGKQIVSGVKEGTRKIGAQTKKGTQAVLSKLGTYVAPTVNTSGNFFGLEPSKEELKLRQAEEEQRKRYPQVAKNAAEKAKSILAEKEKEAKIMLNFTGSGIHNKIIEMNEELKINEIIKNIQNENGNLKPQKNIISILKNEKYKDSLTKLYAFWKQNYTKIPINALESMGVKSVPNQKIAYIKQIMILIQLIPPAENEMKNAITELLNYLSKK